MVCSLPCGLQKGVTVSVKVGAVIESGHQLRQFSALCAASALLTFGYDGALVLRSPDAPPDYGTRLPIHYLDIYIALAECKPLTTSRVKS
jgi:hypothetical protein